MRTSLSLVFVVFLSLLPLSSCAAGAETAPECDIYETETGDPDVVAWNVTGNVDAVDVDIVLTASYAAHLICQATEGGHVYELWRGIVYQLSTISVTVSPDARIACIGGELYVQYAEPTCAPSAGL